MTTRPPRLSRGDVIGIFSPSSEISSFQRRLQRAIDAIATFGFVPKLAANARAHMGQVAGTPAERAWDFHRLLDDDQVMAILCTTGGWSTNGILPLIDFALLRRRPKIICGYSDITALLIAAYARADVVTFHGPTLLPSFGDFGGPMPYTIERWLEVVCTGSSPIDLRPPQVTSDEFLYWDRDDGRPRTTKPATPWRGIAGGSAEGLLIGGNLTTFCKLVGTPYMPDLKGAILFFEESGGSVAQVESQLEHLSQLGLLAGIKGLLFGRPANFSDHQERGLADVLRELGLRLGISVVMDVDFGHTDPRLTLPIGVRARLDGQAGTVTLLDPAVA